MHLLNVSAGGLHAVQIGTEVVTTGHLKVPQPEPWHVTDDGIPGDKRAVHPDKIYAFSRQAYAYWGEQLGVEAARWPDGFFGENLTFDTLDESDLRIGDVFTLGEEVCLFVAGARSPCLKLSWRLGQPPAFQRAFAKSRHAGVYFGVESPGRVRPGDRLRRIAHNPAMPSVADVSDFLIERDPPPLEPLQRLLGYARLSGTNRLLLSAKREAAERAQDRQEGRWRGWRPFVVSKVTQEAPEIRSVEFSPADGGRLPRAKPGQHVQVQFEHEGATIRRAWSLSAFSFTPERYRVTVRKQQGKGSQGLHALRLGDTVSLSAPAGDFTLDMGSYRPLVLIAAGIGITPLKAMLDAHFSRRDAPPAYLIYGGRSPKDLAFWEELEALAAAREDFSLTLIYSRAEVPGALHGRITPERVIAALSDLSVVVNGHRHALPWFEAAIHICGPGSLCTDLKDALVARGANANTVLFEQFGRTVERSEVVEASVRFAKSEQTIRWFAGDDFSLLELAEAAGIAVPNSCRSGSCLTCRSALIKGTSTADLGDGTCLPCIARPQAIDLVVDI